MKFQIDTVIMGTGAFDAFRSIKTNQYCYEVQSIQTGEKFLCWEEDLFN